MRRFAVIAGCLALVASVAQAQVTNVKVVTDASPDFTDMQSLVHSVTSKWETTKDKCWAMFYWMHIARRQTSPMMLHGLELTDPIRQCNDYGYTMCSTIAGINCGIWHHMGMKVKFWDITAHTVSECFYDDRWHIYDDSMSALYTLCDGVTVAGVEDVGKTGACEASGGKNEPGHIAKYHCLNAGSHHGFLTGADTQRDLDQEYRCFNPQYLKFRWYYNNWDWGHRYILNVRADESYTRHYSRKDGDAREWFVPNNGKDPESVNERYRIRANGWWRWNPRLTPADYKRSIVAEENLAALPAGGLRPLLPARPAHVVFKVNAANVVTSQVLRLDLLRRNEADAVTVAVSTTNGLRWTDVWKPDKTGELDETVRLIDEVNGSYEVLIRVTMQAVNPLDVALRSLDVETRTMVNSKTQPQLLLGKNTVYVGAGEPTDSIVLWPELQGGKYKTFVVEEKNMTSTAKHIGYQGTLHAEKPNEEAYVVFRVDAPRDIRKVTYGGRLYNRAPKSHIDFLHSFDGGRTWTKSYSLTETKPPWDVIEHVTVDAVPAGTRSVLFKYLLDGSEAAASGCSIYSVRMEVNHDAIDPGFKPLEVTFTWDEVRPDRKTIERSHTQLVDRLPMKYVVNTTGADQPVVKSLRVNTRGAVPDVQYGYADGQDVGGEKYLYRWVSYGKNFLEGKPYTLSTPPTGAWGGDDPDCKKLTNGIVGPNYPGGISPTFGGCWDKPVEITVDIGETKTCGAFRIHTCGGYPWWEALKGQVKDEIEVLTSVDGKEFTSHGMVNQDLRLKDVPINHFLPDDMNSGGWNFELIPEAPVKCRYVRFKVTPRRIVAVTEVQALDFIRYEPWDIRIALPDEKP